MAVQACWKGFSTRLWYAKLRVLTGVIVIQRCWRHFKLRTRLVDVVGVHVAARRIQSCWRMHFTRRKYKYGSPLTHNADINRCSITDMASHTHAHAHAQFPALRCTNREPE